jgi:RNA polymerase sigma-70 factor (ECF subfamily)
MRDSYARKTDAFLLKRSGRDPEAFAQFYRRHADAVLVYFQRRTASPETAADLAAEAFATAFLKRRTYRDTGAPAEAWLFGICRRLLADLFRSEQIARRAREARRRPARPR